MCVVWIEKRKKIHLNRRPISEAKSIELMLSMFFFLIYWNLRMCSPNRKKRKSIGTAFVLLIFFQKLKTLNSCSGWFFFSFYFETPINLIQGGYINRKKEKSPRTEVGFPFQLLLGVIFFLFSIDIPIVNITDRCIQ